MVSLNKTPKLAFKGNRTMPRNIFTTRPSKLEKALDYALALVIAGGFVVGLLAFFGILYK